MQEGWRQFAYQSAAKEGPGDLTAHFSCLPTSHRSSKSLFRGAGRRRNLPPDDAHEHEREPRGGGTVRGRATELVLELEWGEGRWVTSPMCHGCSKLPSEREAASVSAHEHSKVKKIEVVDGQQRVVLDGA